MEYFVTFSVLAAFGYFIYTRVQKSRNKQSGGGSGGGGNSRENTHIR